MRDFARGMGKSEQQIGALAGLLAAAGPFPRSISSFPWGMISDRIGRKVTSLPCTVSSIKHQEC